MYYEPIIEMVLLSDLEYFLCDIHIFKKNQKKMYYLSKLPNLEISNRLA